MNTKSKGLKIYSWTRFLIFLAIMILIAFLAGGFVFKSTVSGMEEQQYETIVVMTGDTLWDIAKEYNQGDSEIRDLIQEICSVNDVTAGNLYPGQTLKIPIG